VPKDVNEVVLPQAAQGHAPHEAPPQHVNKVVELPQAAQEHLSDTARAQLAEHAPHVITTPAVEPPPPANEGIYLSSGAFGAGWYHYSTPGNDVWLGHEGQPDFYIFDFNLQPDGTLSGQGSDFANTFDSGGLDRILPVDTIATNIAGERYEVRINFSQGQPDIVFMETIKTGESPYVVVNPNVGVFDWDITL